MQVCTRNRALREGRADIVAPVSARRLAEVIAGPRASGAAVILAESSLTHAHPLLDRVFVIDRGAVAENGGQRRAAAV